MTPTIVSGSEIVVGATSAETLAPDDIALFALGARLFAHRFVGRRHGKDGRPVLEFCGDAAVKSDPLVDAGAVIGLVLKIEPPRPRAPGRGWAVGGIATVADALARAFMRGSSPPRWQRHEANGLTAARR